MNIFIDTQDMEERYGEELYKEYLENQYKLDLGQIFVVQETLNRIQELKEKYK